VGMLGHMRRGRVGAVAVVFVSVLTPVPLARPVAAGGGNPGTNPPPANPVFFVHADHLGSTLMLTCYATPVAGCADREVFRYYRYDAYGRTRVFDGAGVELPAGPQPTERLFTGQIWDWAVDVYYFGARHYVPEVAVFMSHDPAMSHPNPYTYVGWAPLRLIDPSGEEFVAIDIALSGAIVGSLAIAVSAAALPAAAGAVVFGAAVGGVFGAAAAAYGPNATASSIGVGFAVGLLGGGLAGPATSAIGHFIGLGAVRTTVAANAVAGGLGSFGEVISGGGSYTDAAIVGLASGLVSGIGAYTGLNLVGDRLSAAVFAGASGIHFAAVRSATSTEGTLGDGGLTGGSGFQGLNITGGGWGPSSASSANGGNAFGSLATAIGSVIESAGSSSAPGIGGSSGYDYMIEMRSPDPSGATSPPGGFGIQVGF